MENHKEIKKIKTVPKIHGPDLQLGSGILEYITMNSVVAMFRF